MKINQKLKRKGQYSFNERSICVENGYTLIEMVIVIGLISAIGLVMAIFLTQSLKTYRLNNQSVKLEEDAASVMRNFELQTRAASQIITATNNELKFYRFFDLTSSAPTQVRYFIDGSQFKIGLTEPVGTAPNITYPVENEKIELLVDNVANTNLLFTYYDGTNSKLLDPVSIASIKMVELSITLDKDPNLPPDPITQSTRVSLRNMKDNL